MLLLLLWIFGGTLGITHRDHCGRRGCGDSVVTGVLTWKDMAKNSSAWSTLIFFSVLVGMAEQLNRLGVITWIGDGVAVLVPGMPWMLAFAILTLAYFYAHYFFASNTAQIVAMYAFFLTAAVAAGASWFARRAPR